MKTILATILSAALAGAAFAQVPSLINYQGRLTDANGDPVTGSKNFAISIYDAATAGNLLYTESIGAVTLDDNGVYSFQFGSAGTSDTQVTETIGTTAGSTLTYTKTLSNTPVVANSITVTDGTNSWNQSVGNPGVAATATASRASGFVIGAEITNGGSGYTSAPLVTITGSGSGATATATLTGGVVTDITINSAGSGYSGGATITIAPPVIPFRVDYSGGAITATYSTAAAAGRTITATYRYGTSGITGALGSGAEHWMAVSVEGTPQATRQRVIAVPFAHFSAQSHTSQSSAYANNSGSADAASGSLAVTISNLNRDLALVAAGIGSQNIFSEKFTVPSGSAGSVVPTETTLNYRNSFYTAVTESTNVSGLAVPSFEMTPSIGKVRGITVHYVRSGGSPSSHWARYDYNDGTFDLLPNYPFEGGSTYVPNPKPSKIVSKVTVGTSGKWTGCFKDYFAFNTESAGQHRPISWGAESRLWRPHSGTSSRGKRESSINSRRIHVRTAFSWPNHSYHCFSNIGRPIFGRHHENQCARLAIYRVASNPTTAALAANNFYQAQ